MSRFLGQFKENTGMFVVTAEDNVVHVSCTKRAFDGDTSNLNALADKIKQSAQSFVIDLEQFRSGHRSVLSVEGSIRSLYVFDELFKRTYNSKDEVDVKKFAETLENLTTCRQFTKILVNVMHVMDELDVDLGVSYR